MRRYIAAALVLAIVVASALGRSYPLAFALRSPDGRFDAVCKSTDTPIFKIVERATGRVIIAFVEESTSNRGLDAAWAPDSKTLAVLMEWRLFHEVLICRLRDDSFVCTAAPSPPEPYIDLAGWTSPEKLHLKGEKRMHTLLVTPTSQKYVR